MDIVISAITGDLVSRFLSFLTNKYSTSRASSEKKLLERLRQLLLRVRIVVEEADGRYITNSGMLAQLQVLADAMYQGYCVLDTFHYCRSLAAKPMEEEEEEVSDPSVLSLATSLKRRCRSTVTITTAFCGKDKDRNLDDLHAALERLEFSASSMEEFVLLLCGCDRMLRRPYDAYLYAENFMFGRHTEKQTLFNFLLLPSNDHNGSTPVLAIIGDHAVGKKTLVAHVCNDDRVRSHFSSIMHLSGYDILRPAGCQRIVGEGKALVVVELALGVDEKGLLRLYSIIVERMETGSRVVIISKVKISEKIGTVKPILLSCLPYEEFRYFFKILAFRSTNPAEHPQLVRIADEFSRELQLGWSLVAANAFADVMRSNLNPQFWLSMLKGCKRAVQRNISVSGEHPMSLHDLPYGWMDKYMTHFQLFPAAPLHVVWSRKSDVSGKKELPVVTFGELIVDPRSRPKGEFNIVTWQSRLPPYTSFVHFVPSCYQNKPEDALLSGGKRRRGVPF